MLSLNDLLLFAKAKDMPQEKRRGIVREYLQTLALYFIQQTVYAPKLIFIGGTALRFLYQLERFSEDLDFNYLGTLKEKDLHTLMKYVQREFLKEGVKLQFSIRKSQETYFHWKIYLNFPGILQEYGCGGKKGHLLHPLEKLSIQLDFQNLGRKKYPVVPKIISHFGKRFVFNTTDLNMFLAEKSNAVLYRNPPMGRDVFDLIALLLRGARVNISLLRGKDISVNSKKQYCTKIRNRIKKMDVRKLTVQLTPFLMRNEDVKIMENFPLHVDDLLGKV